MTGRSGVRAVVLACLMTTASSGQVVTDGSLGSGPGAALSGPDYTIDPHLGQTVGNNLFHSFSQFNVNAGESATFTGPAHIVNVLSRVTGGSPSTIDGLLRTEAMPRANFFLINPNGVAVGPGAQLDIGGAFVVTTADRVEFSDRGFFAASMDPAQSVLTTASPAAFGFLNANPAAVTIEGAADDSGRPAVLSVDAGQAVSVVAGDVQIVNGRIEAGSGAVNIVSAASPGRVGLDPTDVNSPVDVGSLTSLGHVSLEQDTQINTDQGAGGVEATPGDDPGGGGGRVLIRGGRVTIEDSSITARTFGSQDGRGVDIEVRGQMSLVRSSIDTSSDGPGDQVGVTVGGSAGAIRVVADRVTIDARDTDRQVGFFAASLGEFVDAAADLLLTLDITHTFDSDLAAFLISPDGSFVFLFGGVGGAGENFADTVFDDRAATSIFEGQAPFTGSFQPQQPLGALVGEPAHGAWLLQVVDQAPGDDGTLNAWSIQIGSEVFESTDVGQAISDTLPVVASTLLIDQPGLTVPGSGGFDPGLPGDVTVTANQIEVLGRPSLSSEADPAIGAGSLQIDVPQILLDGQPAGFDQPQPGMGEFFVLGGVELDGTFGAAGPLPGPQFMITDDLGHLEGTSLFHSFQRFDVSRGQTAIFSGPASVVNVIGRVTGGVASQIDGVLRSTIDGANVFLLNPAGFIFGPRAVLDLSGSLAVTSADRLDLPSGGRFTGTGDVVLMDLTDGPPVSFGFEDTVTGPAPIIFEPSSLGQVVEQALQPGEVLSLVGGPITTRGTRLGAPSGRVNLVSVASAGQVLLDATAVDAAVDLASIDELGEVVMLESEANINGDGGGMIVVRAAGLTLDNSDLLAETSGDVDGGLIDVQLTGDLLLTNDGELQSLALSSGDGSGIRVRARNVFLTGIAAIGSEARVGSTGNAGDIDVVATARVEMAGAGGIVSDTSGLGDGADIAISAADVSIFGDIALGLPLVVAATVGAGEDADPDLAFGMGGNITISATERFSIAEFAAVNAVTIGPGSGGDLSLNAPQISIGSPLAFFPSSVAVQTAGQAHAGQMTISASSLEVVNGGVINTTTLGAGNAGQIRIVAGDVVVDNMQSSAGSIIAAQSFPQGFDQIPVGGIGDVPGGGDAGSIVIEAGRLAVFNGGSISVETTGTGDGGVIQILADQVLLDGAGDSEFLTGIFASTSLTQPHGGQGGNIQIGQSRGEDLQIVNGAQIGASTEGTGDGGSVTVRVGTVQIDSGGSVEATSSFLGDPSTMALPGSAGTVDLQAEGSVFLSPQGPWCSRPPRLTLPMPGTSASPRVTSFGSPTARLAPRRAWTGATSSSPLRFVLTYLGAS